MARARIAFGLPTKRGRALVTTFWHLKGPPFGPASPFRHSGFLTAIGNTLAVPAIVRVTTAAKKHDQIRAAHSSTLELEPDNTIPPSPDFFRYGYHPHVESPIKRRRENSSSRGHVSKGSLLFVG